MKEYWVVRRYYDEGFGSEMERESFTATEEHAKKLIIAQFLNLWTEEDEDVWLPKFDALARQVFRFVREGKLDEAVEMIKVACQEPAFKFDYTWTWDKISKPTLTDADGELKRAIKNVETPHDE